MTTAVFPSAQAAWDFAEAARAQGHRTEVVGETRIVTRRSAAVGWLSALVGGLVFGLVGGLAEGGYVGLPRLEPLFAAPVRSVSMLLGALGGGVGAVIGSLAALPRVERAAPEGSCVRVDGDGEGVVRLVRRYGGRAGAAAPAPAPPRRSPAVVGERDGSRGGAARRRWRCGLVLALGAR